ncbi:hypothetical protein [Mycetohabitans sp. B2]|nr:hypothetical protein [Mycetohabitans sp. B2]
MIIPWPECAQLWLAPLQHLPQIELTLLVGQYVQCKVSPAETVWA